MLTTANKKRQEVSLLYDGGSPGRGGVGYDAEGSADGAGTAVGCVGFAQFIGLGLAARQDTDGALCTSCVGNRARCIA